MEDIILASKVLPSLGYTYETIISKEYGSVFLLSEKNIIVCELNKEYVTIEDFKTIFQEITPFIKKYQIEKFIFDKRALRVFHQPSMEWYFVHWKKEIFELGLNIHRKILPTGEPYFNIAVEAGRAKIMKEYKNTVIPQLDIQYKETLLEAIES